MEIEFLDVVRLEKPHAVEHHDHAVTHRQEASVEVAHRAGAPQLGASGAVGAGEIGFHVAELGSAILG